jgi:hypothetical protein
MRFYIAFQVPKRGDRTAGPGPGGQAVPGRRGQTASGLGGQGVTPPPPAAVTDYDINGTNFQVTSSAVRNVAPRTIQLTINNEVALRVNDNSQLRTEKSHTVFFDKVRARPDGSYEGYIVVETVPIVSQGGSININVKTRRSTGLLQGIPRDTVILRK